MCIVTSFHLDPALKDAFGVLGVENIDDAKKAYHKLATKYHPDRNYGNEAVASEKFKIVNEAYSVIKKTQEPQEPLQRTASQIESLHTAPSRLSVTFDNLNEGVSNTGAHMAGMIFAGTVGNAIAPDTFQQIPLDLVGNQLMKTVITSTVVTNVCGNSIECNVVGALLTSTVMDTRFSNNKKIEAINGAKIILKKQIETFKDIQNTAQ